MKKPLALVILDGYGLADQTEGNAIRAAKTPNLDRIFAENPHTQLQASGLAVGLPEGQMGNSEVGHTNMGAGRVVYQELTRITKSIKDGDFYQNPVLLAGVRACKEGDKALHLLGLLSDGGVHSHLSHLLGLIELAKREGLEKVYVHAFLDGRDVPPHTAGIYLKKLVEGMEAIGVGKLATFMGRYYAMDRDNRWERVERAYAAMVYGEGSYNPDYEDALEKSYKKEITDEFVEPTVCDQQGMIREGDTVVFFNFRPDRAREITRALVDPEFTGFNRRLGYFPLHYICMTQYDATMPGVQIAFPPQKLENTLGEYLSAHGKRQLRIAETEKYAHVTFFFNGGVEAVYPGEDRVLIPSPKVATYDLQPEMSAFAVTEEALRRIDSGEYDVIILNYANCDMVGHTGVYEAAVKAVEAVDACVGQLVDHLLKAGGAALITADHGNADQMMAEDGSPFTAHTTNPVPFVAAGISRGLREGGILADIAPTMLELLELPQPTKMTGRSLLQ